ncbi:bifunctional non-homologous end joining protein LigD [Saccharopolyspora kobensis]|uniref:Bifunctional non-homologous end joining protein LigD n=1 Tax=Saccharopolyspora kobensis TaxID=146035 RepID=A0A1H5UGI8_9PSEU|nr:non-homologous end-joining DNA ligase [Saccharopolyspora kobensis]SEF73568.1 bifunctional non-homologous end joining protein LigD [Saccharopolyspora kobensis]SFC74173.1 bifunctional non-homologous end joining protein LigD [Saccharopolyspora kobensis]
MSARWEADGHRFDVSNPDKVLYPGSGYRKQDVMDYYRSVAEVMIAHSRGRPLTLRRFPDGIGDGGFFQKEASDYFPDWIRVVSVPQRGARGVVHHVVVDDAATLLYLAGQACLEFHLGLSTVDDLERPVLVVLDLDPPEGTGLTELRQVTRRMCERFRDAGLDPHVQTTGGRGFHVAAPLRAEREFDEVRADLRELAEEAVRDEPRRLTTEQRKDQRGDRIFLDTNRNAYGQTAIAPYSLRARPGAPAATPLDIDELGRAEPQSYGLANMARRLAQKSDPWADLTERR